jgi:hypothetical protein
VECIVLFFAVEDSQWWYSNRLLRGTFVKEIREALTVSRTPQLVTLHILFEKKEKERVKDTIEIADGEGA